MCDCSDCVSEYIIQLLLLKAFIGSLRRRAREVLRQLNRLAANGDIDKLRISGGGVDKLVTGEMYEVYPSSIKLLAKHNFCTFDDFMDFVNEYQHIGFHVKANRYRVTEAFNRLRGVAPFSATIRFPEEFYVHMDNPSVKVWTEQMLQALDLPDRVVKRGTVGSSMEMMGINSLTDAKRSYDVAMSRLSAIVRCVDVVQLEKYGIYDRDSFERSFSLRWIRNV